MAGVLEGVTIIEMEGIGPAPFCGMMLADHGARVIRVARQGARDAAGRDVLGRVDPQHRVPGAAAEVGVGVVGEHHAVALVAGRQHEGVGTGNNPVDGSLVEFSAEVDALAEAAGGDLGTQAGRMRRIPPVRSDAQQPPSSRAALGQPR